MQVGSALTESIRQPDQCTKTDEEHMVPNNLFSSVVLTPPPSQTEAKSLYSDAVENVLLIVTRKTDSLNLILLIQNTIQVLVDYEHADRDKLDQIILFFEDIFSDYDRNEEKEFVRFFGMFAQLASNHFPYLLDLINSSSTEDVIDEVYSQHEALLKKMMVQARSVKEAHCENPVQNPRYAYLNSLAKLASNHLLLSNGKINIGVIEELLALFPERRTKSEEYFVGFLKKLGHDSELIEVIEQAADYADKIDKNHFLLHHTLGKRPSEPLTQRDVVWALLSSLLYLCDENSDSSFPEVFLKYIAKQNTLQLAKDYRQLIISGTKRFPALKKEESPLVQLKPANFTLHVQVKMDAKIPPGIRRVLHALDLTDEDLETAWGRIGQPEADVKTLLNELAHLSYHFQSDKEEKLVLEDMSRFACNAFVSEAIHPLQRAWDEVTASAIGFDLTMSPQKIYTAYCSLFHHEFHQRGNRGSASEILSWILKSIKKNCLHEVDGLKRISATPNELLLFIPSSKTIRRYFERLRRRTIDSELITAWFKPTLSRAKRAKITAETQQAAIKEVLTFIDIKGCEKNIVNPFSTEMNLFDFRNTLISMLKLFSEDIERHTSEIDTIIFHHIDEKMKKNLLKKMIVTHESTIADNGYSIFYGWAPNPFTQKIELVQVLPHLSDRLVRFIDQKDLFCESKEGVESCWSLPKYFEELPA